MKFPRFNPFSFIFTSRKQPHFRTINTTFKQKVVDAYNIFSGFSIKNDDETDKEEQLNFGVYDWATLFIPRLLEIAGHFIWKNCQDYCMQFTRDMLNNSINLGARKNLFLNLLLFVVLGIVQLIAMCVWGPLFLARNLIAGLLTLASLPVIGLISLISMGVKKHFVNKLIENSKETNAKGEEIGTGLNFLEDLKKTNQEIDFVRLSQEGTVKVNELKFSYLYKDPQTNNNQLRYFSMRDNAENKDILEKLNIHAVGDLEESTIEESSIIESFKISTPK